VIAYDGKVMATDEGITENKIVLCPTMKVFTAAPGDEIRTDPAAQRLSTIE
jgi:hypothetical protein